MTKTLLLDHDDFRIKWFFDRLTSITVAKGAPDAVAILDSYLPFDFIFLDDDLGLFTGTEKMACKLLSILQLGALMAGTHLSIPRIRTERQRCTTRYQTRQ